MVQIETFVFFDIETTGLPWQERNQTKITDISFVAAARKDIQRTTLGEIPPVSKLSLPLHPDRQIHPKAVELTGLTNDSLKYASRFGQKIKSITSFLEELPKPVCLVAHNGNTFDYKILQAEFNDANAKLPIDLLCVDSLACFRKFLKGLNQEPTILPNINQDIITDDEDEWPKLNATTEDWNEIDNLCENLSDVSCEDFSGHESDERKNNIKKAKSESIRNVFERKSKNQKNNVTQEKKQSSYLKQPKDGFSLSALYKRFFNKEEKAHRAEIDCLMLLKCVVALKTDFIEWADINCKSLTDIEPLKRY